MMCATSSFEWCLCAGYPFYAALSAGGAHLLWQVATTDFDDRQDCYDK